MGLAWLPWNGLGRKVGPSAGGKRGSGAGPSTRRKATSGDERRRRVAGQSDTPAVGSAALDARNAALARPAARGGRDVLQRVRHQPDYAILIAVVALTAIGILMVYSSSALLWSLMLSIPFPYIATTAGWMTAELGRQPWLIYGLMRTANGASANVSAGNGLFSLLGFMGLYMVLGILFLFLIAKEVREGPSSSARGIQQELMEKATVLA